MKALVVANCVSGKGKAVSVIPTVEAFLEQNGIEHTLMKTLGKEQDIPMIRDVINNYDFAICMGGDGTVNEMVNATMLANSKTPIGYIPCGSTNDFATNYFLSSDPKTAMENILKLKPKMLDVGTLNGNYFCYVAASGAFAEVSYATSRAKKQMLGKAAYMLEGAKSLPKIKPIEMRIEANGEVFEGKYLICTYSNSTRIGGVFKYDEGMVDYTDGLMELTFIEDPGSPTAFLVFLSDLFTGNFSNKNIHVLHTDSAKIITEKPIDWSLDGEYGGSFCESEIKTHKNRFALLC